MNDAPGLIYLEADDEVTSVVRRLRGSADPRLVLVAPGRSRATSSAVALRLLARVATGEGRELAVVGDALTRSLAAEAGLAAYVSVEDARQAVAPDATAHVAPRAAIHVVRGARVDDTAPTMAAAAAPAIDAATAETRATPIARTRPTSARSRTAWPPAIRGGRVPLAAAAALVAVVLAGAGVAAATLLPAATVTLVPRTGVVPDRTYTIPVDDAERRAGAVERTASVAATGTYSVAEFARGEVTFNNWSGSPVEVPSGTLVAAGVQAFETVAPVVVPAGRLTPEGFIAAGQATAPVVARAPGPDANVRPGAIDTVLSEGPRNRLRAYADNPEMLVQNAAPTAGGSATTGVEITEADVDAALASLRQELAEERERELDDAGAIAVPIGALPEPSFEGADGLVGTRDEPEAEIRGTLAFDAWLVDLDSLERAAADRLAEDDTAVPEGHTLLTDGVSVEVTAAEATPDGVEVTVVVGARAVRDVDEGVVIDRVRGLSADDAEAELLDLGEASLALWPEWVREVPELDWRIEVRIERVGSPAEVVSPGASP